MISFEEFCTGQKAIGALADRQNYEAFKALAATFDADGDTYESINDKITASMEILKDEVNRVDREFGNQTAGAFMASRLSRLPGLR